MTLGERIASERNAKGLSQRALARACGVSQPTISAIESSTKAPSTVTIGLIASALGVTVSYLMGEESTQTEPKDIYLDSIHETLYRRPGMRILFDAARNAPDDVLQKTADLLEAMKNGTHND